MRMKYENIILMARMTWRPARRFSPETSALPWTPVHSPPPLTGVKTRFLKPTVGFEPTTTGLQNQSSTAELRWHNHGKS